MRKIVFATNNLHKLDEVRSILKGKALIVSLSDIGCTDDIPETASTLEENAVLKASYIYNKFGISCFADDTGLEIEALDGRPGVFSARYAGEPSNSSNNVKKVLTEMEGQVNRTAQFRTMITYLENGEYHLFEGIVKGKIATEPRGNTGFGYDPVFIPEGYEKTFAEMSPEIKNTISHRAVAIKKLADYFDTLIL